MGVKLKWSETMWTRVQDVVPWTLGALGIVNELFVEPKPRPEAWPIIGVLIGLPFARRQDRQRDDQGDGEGTSP